MIFIPMLNEFFKFESIFGNFGNDETEEDRMVPAIVFPTWRLTRNP